MNMEIEQVDSFNFLGIQIDNDMKWTSHINNLACKLLRTVGILNKLNKLLPIFTLLNIYNSLVLSNLNYGQLVWGYHATRIIQLQKRIVRILNNSSFYAHTDPIFKNLKILKFEDIRFINELKFLYNFSRKMVPDYFKNFLVYINEVHTYNTRNINNLRNIKPSHEFMKLTARYKLVETLNDCPENIKEKIETHSIKGLSNYAKQKMIEKYKNSCNIENCYVCENNS